MEVTVLCIRLLLNLFLLLIAGGKRSYSAQEVGDVFLRIDPNKLQFFEYESISLRCVGSHGPSEWRVMKNFPSNSIRWATSAGFLNITPALVSHSGEYVCENKAGERSNAINITITAGDVILESPALPVREGENVTLRCRKRSFPNLPSDFYKDGKLFNTGYLGEVIIDKVSKSDEGLYKCRISSSQGESAENWLTVTADNVILEIPALPVTEGDNLVLPCRTRTSANLPGDFYKDGIFIKTEYSGQITLLNISTSDEGLYKCVISGSGGESPETWLTVTVTVALLLLVGLLHCGKLRVTQQELIVEKKLER
ncbi:hypothetical protein Q5P01_000342 [Channa striata]|uniref:Ig-like domain-containing protein n=1 Tax=Channa striata TaxID=64152 RepID=A0AA88IH72_CHASR|nr:hypothetical protein Q5P01_000342 [Channa striata]